MRLRRPRTVWAMESVVSGCEGARPVSRRLPVGDFHSVQDGMFVSGLRALCGAVAPYRGSTRPSLRATKRGVWSTLPTHIGAAVRTNIVFDDELLKGAMRATGATTKREVVELGLASLIKLKEQERIRGLRRKLRWTGDLEAMRRDR